MKYREPPSDLSGIGPIYRNGSVLGDFVPSRNVESADFGSVSSIGSAHKIPSLLGALECRRPPLADQVRLGTCG